MEGDSSSGASRRLHDVPSGDGPVEELFPLVYGQLRAMAGRRFRSLRAGETLQPTALVHEAYLRLAQGEDAMSFNDRAHFLAVASTALRQILIQHARKRAATKRGGRMRRITLDESATPDESDRRNIDLLALDEAMTKLASVDERGARVVHLKFFGGLTSEEIAAVLSISRSTVEDDWRVARAWLHRELSPGGAP